MDDKITIIEGPPPTFESIADGWALSLTDTPALSEIALTRLRTFNGPALVERCIRAWRSQQIIQLEYRAPDGLKQYAPIVAARASEVDEGQMLILWVRLTTDGVKLELGYDDDTGDEADEDPGLSDY